MRSGSVMFCALVALAQALPDPPNVTNGFNCREIALAASAKPDLAPRGLGLSPDQPGDNRRSGNTKRVKIAVSGMS
jgi:hypothetical protein